MDAADHYVRFGHREGRAYKPPVERTRFLERIQSLENFVWLLNRMPDYHPPTLAVSATPSYVDDAQLVKRVMAAYKESAGHMKPTDGFWDVWNYGLKKPIHDALCGTDEAAASRFLRDPASSTFFWGFDAIAHCPDGQTEPHELVLTRLCRSTDWKELYAYWVCDSL